MIDTLLLDIVYANTLVTIYEGFQDGYRITLWRYSDGSPDRVLISKGDKPQIEFELPE